LPLLRPTHFLVVLMLTINTFKVFDQPYVISTFGNSSVAGGPAGATSTVVIFLYQNAFKYFKMGYASAAAVVLFLAVFVLTIIQRRFFEGNGKGEAE
jgi:ABC-type sugar transport system permease subunit